MQAFNGTSSEFNVYLSESVLARILITVRTTPGAIPDCRRARARGAAVAAARRWDDDLKQALIEALGEARGNELFRQFGDAFPAGYREDFTARDAVPDIEMMARLSAAEPLAMSLYRPLEAAAGTLRFKLLHRGEPVSAVGQPADARAHGPAACSTSSRIASRRDGMPPVWMHDFGLQSGLADTEVEIDIAAQVFEEAFAQHLPRRGRERRLQSPGAGGASARRPRSSCCAPTRSTCARSAFRCRSRSSKRRSPRTPTVARVLVELFKTRFDPELGAGAGARAAEQVRAIEAALDAGRQSVGGPRAAPVPGADAGHDAHEFLASRRRRPPQAASCRSSSTRPRCPDLPEPKPMFEIFVYSTRFEGVHLRGGKVARGGLRWSDRPEDFRTEVLGLVKAQMVKNTVIVPVGSKGGFVLKRAPSPADREAYHEGRHRLLPGLPARPARHHRQPRRRRHRAAAAR